METRADRLERLAHELADTLPCADVSTLDDEETLRCTAAAEAIGRRVDALRVSLAGEVAERSRPARGAHGLAAQRACRTPADLLEQITLISGATARRRIALGADLARRPFPGGSTTRARFDRVRAAFTTGLLGEDAALAITRGLSPLLAHSSLVGLATIERELVGVATGTRFDSEGLFNTDTDPSTGSGTDLSTGSGTDPSTGSGTDPSTGSGTDTEGDPSTGSGTDTGADPWTGSGIEGPAVSADQVKIMAAVWRAAIDPDGLDPAENRAMTRRDLRFGREHDGLVTMRCEILAEAAGRAMVLFDSFLSPTTAPAFLSEEERDAHNLQKDPRTPGQQRHDILVGILDTMARSGNTPTIGGAAPTVLVSVRAEDLESGHGVGYNDRTDTPISMTTVKQLICTGGTQTVTLNSDGRILSLGSPERCFTYPQRRAITLRDGGCLIPGCTIPAGWCEIHHVLPAAEGGPTHTDNGVLLCWYHHRTIDTSGWQIRMHRGSPQIKAPPWIDSTGTWKPATKSRTTLTRQLKPPP